MFDSSVRLFVGVKPNIGHAYVVANAMQSQLLFPWQAKPEEHLHLTLLFLGEADRHDVREIECIVGEIAEKTHGFTLTHGIPVFMQFDDQKMLWVHYRANGHFLRLVDKLETELSNFGTWKNEHIRRVRSLANAEEPIPHVTIAEAKGDNCVNIIDTLRIPDEARTFRCDNMCLYAVERFSSGTSYRTLCSFELPIIE